MTDWGVDELDLDAYLRRIGVTEPTLHNIHAAHVATIPFENVTVLLGETPRLDLPGLQAKLVGRRRGGYCYEHNLLYAAALERLGIPVTRLAARPAVGEGEVRPRTHMMLLATVDGSEWLTDVGWGAGGLLEPIPLDGGTVTQGVWTYRLVREDSQWVFQCEGRDGWETMYRFAVEHTYPADYAMANHYTATWSGSPSGSGSSPSRRPRRSGSGSAGTSARSPTPTASRTSRPSPGRKSWPRWPTISGSS
ncbi:hypothetical protein GCM10029964_025140 [Kibdelosporangium lantanae]